DTRRNSTAFTQSDEKPLAFPGASTHAAMCPLGPDVIDLVRHLLRFKHGRNTLDEGADFIANDFEHLSVLI
ncbi:hypothetical protein, partial [Pseudovibrio sp. POLY-S9]|uniref:hypothetical protein n=1 Tax=Pseudovibrio sp. POLY-S9 TaxID=1576596 RepID=UPI000A600396